MTSLLELSNKLNKVLGVFILAFCFAASITFYTHPEYITLFFGCVLVVLLVLAISLKSDINVWSMLLLILALTVVEYLIELFLMAKITSISPYYAYAEKILLVMLWYKAFVYRPYISRALLKSRFDKHIKPMLVEGHLLRIIKYVLLPLEVFMLVEYAFYDLKIFDSAFFYDNYEVFKNTIFAAFFAVLYHGIIFYSKGATEAPSHHIS